MRNNREIYGRFIDKHGLIYEGEFRKNLPNGRGKMWNCNEIEGMYPKGLRFIFEGRFKNGLKEDWGKNQ